MENYPLTNPSSFTLKKLSIQSPLNRRQLFISRGGKTPVLTKLAMRF